ncbi:hypothetical protein [Saccharopolyspora thermophila]|uniref:Uncharacterized protein n=1 Tax=Saccharopolyspora thermophila TaxID=89367 RepID=A0ABN1CTR9_9PSEU
MADPTESLRRFRSELANAVGRSRRARREALHRREDARKRPTKPGGEASSGGQAAAEHRAAALAYRQRMGLEVPEFAEPESNAPAQNSAEPKSQEQTPSDGSDLDFSQARIMR